MTAVANESPMVSYARDEMKRAGMWDEDVNYGKGEIANCVLALVTTLSSQGHSGGSHDLTLGIFARVARYQPLSPLTSNADEWMEVGTKMWQSRRKPSVFSKDGGQTYYDLDEEGRPIHTIESTNQPEA